MPRNEYNPFGTQIDTPIGYTVSPTTPIPDNGELPPSYPFMEERRPANNGYAPTMSAGETQDVGKTEIADEFTIGQEKMRPVVGWLVCTKGVCKGKDFRLHSERNYIGRDEKLDVSIPDMKISRSGPAIQIAYDPNSRGFYVASCPGTQQNSYYNGRLLMGDREMQYGDILKIGDTELIFVPLCGEKFAWEEENQ